MRRREPKSHFLRRVRLIPAMLISLPLLIPVVVVLIAWTDYVEYVRIGERPVLRAWDFVQYHQTRLTGGLRPSVYPEKNPDIAVIELSIPKPSLTRLARALPLSGFEEQAASILTGRGFTRADVRYRGDLGYHWYFPKRSWRLKGEKNDPLPFRREFDLINPKDSGNMVQYVDHLIAKRMNLLTCESRFALLNVNRRYQGVYLMQELNDEGFLRRNGQMPGTIYTADPSIRTTDGRYHEDRLPLHDFFRDPYSWDTDATYSGIPAYPGNAPLVDVLRTLNAGTYWTRTHRAFDEDAMLRFCAFVSLIGSCHYDDFHNVMLFIDPLSGKFRMIEKDSHGLNFETPLQPHPAPDYHGVDITSNAIFRELLRNPVFTFQKNKYLYDWITSDGARRIDDLNREIRAAGELIAPWTEADRLDRAGFNHGRADRGSIEAGKEIIDWLHQRMTWLTEQLDKTELTYSVSRGRLKLHVNGYSPVHQVRITTKSNLNSYERAEDSPENTYGSSGVTSARQDPGALRLSEMLFPGRFLDGFGKGNRWFMRPAPLSYTFQVPGLVPSEIESIEAVNAITGSPVTASPTNAWHMRMCDALHPWDLPAETPQPQTIRIGPGEYILTSNLVVEANTTLEIAPATVLKMAPGVSIISYGPIVADGTEAAPIRITRQNEERAWGVIAVQGQGSRGSTLSNADISGGSDAAHGNVYYSGMVSAYYCPGIKLVACSLSDNLIGDDAFRAAQSIATVEQCRFTSSPGDAIDFDFSDGTITDCTFRDIGNDAVDLMGCSPTIANCLVDGAGDKGISIGEGSSPIIANVRIQDAHIGIEIKDGSRPLIMHSSIAGHRYAVHAYVKNWRYGDGGHARLYHCEVRSTNSVADSDPSSDIALQTCLLAGPPVPPGLQDRISNHGSSPTADGVALSGSGPGAELLCMMVGLPLRNIGAVNDSLQVHTPTTTILDSFAEDYSTALSEWKSSGAVQRIETVGRALVIESVRGEQAQFMRDLALNIRYVAVLIIETYTRGSGGRVGISNESAEIETGFAQTMLPLAPGRHEELVIDLPSGGVPIELHRVMIVTASPSVYAKAPGTER